VRLLLGDALAIVEEIDLDIRIGQTGDIHAGQVSGLKEDYSETSGSRLPAERDQQFAATLGSNLQAAWLNLLADGQGLLGNVPDLDGGQWANHLANNIVARIPIEAEDDKVQRHVLQVVHVQAVEGEVLVVNWVPGITHHAGLNMYCLLTHKNNMY